MLKAMEEADRMRFLEATLSCIGDGVIITDCDATVLYLNASAQRLTGFSQEEAAGMLFDNICPLMEYDSKKPIESPILEALEQKKPVGLKSNTVLATREGDIHFVSASCSPIYRPDGNTEGVVMVFRDIDRLKSIEDALKKSRDEARSANLVKGEFIANMSHEIRTPLNGIIGMMDLLAMTETSPEQGEYIDLAKLSANNLLKIVSDILDFSKLESGKIEIKNISFDIKALMEEVVKIHETSAAKKGLGLSLILSPPVPRHIRGDPDRIRQVLDNLINNAIKFTDRGGVTVSVRNLSQEDKVPKLEFGVADTGVGIAPNKMELLFKRFSQVDGSITRRHSGTGLGLAICKQLAELMGGRMAAESEAEKGSFFTLTIPCTRASESSADALWPLAEERRAALSPIITAGDALPPFGPLKGGYGQGEVVLTDCPASQQLRAHITLNPNGEIMLDVPPPSKPGPDELFKLHLLLRELKGIVSQGRFSSIEQAAHRVKETALILGADKLRDLAFKAELASRKKKWDDATKYCVMIINEINFRYKEG